MCLEFLGTIKQNTACSGDSHFCSSPRRMRWASNVAQIAEMRNAYKIIVENLTGRDHLGRLRIDETTILKWILKIRYANVD
jgi:hypothetical protein